MGSEFPEWAWVAEIYIFILPIASRLRGWWDGPMMSLICVFWVEYLR
jgi:hypothetical protein